MSELLAIFISYKYNSFATCVKKIVIKYWYLFIKKTVYFSFLILLSFFIRLLTFIKIVLIVQTLSNFYRLRKYRFSNLRKNLVQKWGYIVLKTRVEATHIFCIQSKNFASFFEILLVVRKFQDFYRWSKFGVLRKCKKIMSEYTSLIHFSIEKNITVWYKENLQSEIFSKES